MPTLDGPYYKEIVTYLAGIWDRTAQLSGPAITNEPKSAPGTGVFCAVFGIEITPIPEQSGLDITAGRLVVMSRLYEDMLKDPESEIDFDLAAAMLDFTTAISADLTLGGLVTAVDLLGSSGAPMQAQWGYVEVDGKMHRIFDHMVPIEVADAWPQSR